MTHPTPRRVRPRRPAAHVLVDGCQVIFVYTVFLWLGSGLEVGGSFPRGGDRRVPSASFI